MSQKNTAEVRGWCYYHPPKRCESKLGLVWVVWTGFRRDYLCTQWTPGQALDAFFYAGCAETASPAKRWRRTFENRKRLCGEKSGSGAKTASPCWQYSEKDFQASCFGKRRLRNTDRAGRSYRKINKDDRTVDCKDRQTNSPGAAGSWTYAY